MVCHTNLFFRRVEPRLFLDRESHLSHFSESLAIERFGAFWLDSVYSLEIPEAAEDTKREGCFLNKHGPMSEKGKGYHWLMIL